MNSMAFLSQLARRMVVTNGCKSGTPFSIDLLALICNGLVNRPEGVCAHMETAGSWSEAVGNQQVRCVRRVAHKRGTPITEDFRRLVGAHDIGLDTKNSIAEDAIMLKHELLTMEICTIFNGCKRGRFVHKPLFESLTGVLLAQPDTILRLGTIQMSMLVNSLGMLWSFDGHSRPFFNHFDDLVKCLVRECFKREKQRIRENDARGYSTIIHGLGLLYKSEVGFKMDKYVVALVDCMLSKLVNEGGIGHCKPQEIANVLHGCANMMHKRPEFLMPMYDEIHGRLSNRQDSRRQGGQTMLDFNGHDLPMILWSKSKLQERHDELLSSLASFIERNVGGLLWQGLSNSVYGFAIFDYVENQGVLSALSMEIATPRRIGNFVEQELANIVYGFGRLGHLDDACMQSICQEIKKPSRLEKFTPQALANIIFGLGQLSYNKDMECVDLLSMEATKPGNLERFSDQGLGIMIYGLGELGCGNKEVIRALSREAGKPDRMERLVRPALANIYQGFKKLGNKDDGVMLPLSTKMRLWED